MKILYLLLFLSLTGCATTVKRYKTIEKTTVDTNSLVSLDLFGTKVDPAKSEDASKSLWNLDAEGQAQLIKELGSRNADIDKFTGSLENKYFKAKENPATDYTSKDVRLIFSVGKTRDYLHLADQNPSYTLGDRIEYLQFDITIPAATNLNFIKWNKFSTEYATIDVADVSFNQSLSVTASTGLSLASSTEKTDDNVKTTGSTGLTPSVSATGSTGKTENQKIRFRYVSLNGKISDKQISIEQEGMREIDLSGNVIADVNVKFDEVPETLTSAEGYKTAAGAYNTPDKTKITLFTAMVPVITGLPSTIDATLNYQYAYRHIIKGAKTYFEWDDKVEYLKGTGIKTITLFKQKDFLPAFYNIAQKGQDTLTADQRTRIMLKDVNSGDITEMVFPTLGAAQEFLNWLIRYTPVDASKPIVAGSYKLLLRVRGTDSDLTRQSFDNIRSNIQVLPYYR